MKVEKIQNRLYKVISGAPIKSEETEGDMKVLAEQKLATFGDLNTRILARKFREQGYEVETVNLCLEDDISIGLPMPDVAYLNVGDQILSIPMYYNFLTFKSMAKEERLFTTNEEVAEKYGRIGLIEIFFLDKLQSFLDERGIEYFGTPRTLTECMRVLEGWDLDVEPRLRNYVSFANFIHTWSKLNFPNYDESEWFMGRRESENLLKTKGSTNVREAIKFFWKNYLTKKSPRITEDDVEIDVVGGDFYNDRQPDIILVGEDAFSKIGKEKIVFKTLTRSAEIVHSRESVKNDKQTKTAQLLLDAFPNTTIVLYQNPKGQPNFSMTKLDEVKEGVSEEVSVVARGLRFVLEQIQGDVSHEQVNNNLRYVVEPLLSSENLSPDTSVKFELQKGHSVLVYRVICVDSDAQKKEFIVKTTEEERQILALKNEYEIYNLLQPTKYYDLPVPLFSWSQGKNFRLAYEFMDGNLLSSIEIDDAILSSVSSAIPNLQNDLIKLNTELLFKESERLRSDMKFAEKISLLIRVELGLEIPSEILSSLNIFLNTEQEKANRTFVSDRSLNNWLIKSTGKLAVLDFGLVRAGSKYEDWIWFIDNPEFKSKYSREELINFYVEKNDDGSPLEDRKKSLHFAAINLGLLQMCYLYKRDRQLSHFFLKKAIESAREIEESRLLESLLNIENIFN